MKITKRDIEILNFINEFGFCETVHLVKHFAISSKRVNQITRRLVEKGLLLKQQEFCNQTAMYRLTEKGAQFSNLPPLASISLGSYHHSVAVINLYLKLAKQYPEAKWISERSLLHEKFFNGVGKYGHTADAILIFQDKKIAIEVELSQKNNKRLEGIIKSYSTDLSIKEVWYFCTAKTLSAVKNCAGNLTYVKIFKYDDI